MSRQSDIQLYRRTQLGLTSWLILLAIAGYVILVSAITSAPIWIISTTLGILFLCGILLSSLTLRVTTNAVEWWFTFGIAKQHVALAEIDSVRTSKSTIMSGFGVHYGPDNSVLWAVGGFDVVTLDLKDGRHIGISTNDPRAVTDVISPLLSASAPQVDRP